MKKNGKKKKNISAKRGILITLAAILLTMAVLYVILLIIEKSESKIDSQTNKYTFSIANYDENIFEDKVYVSYDRSIYYTDLNSGMTVTVSKDDTTDVSETYRDAVLFLLDYIDAMINGDVDSYNDCYAPEFYDTNRSPKTSFTMQKLYRMNLTSVDWKYVDDGDEALRYYNISIEYMIKNNNGTLRSDMGSDAIRKIYLTIKEDGAGNMLITDESYAPWTE